MVLSRKSAIVPLLVAAAALAVGCDSSRNRSASAPAAATAPSDEATLTRQTSDPEKIVRAMADYLGEQPGYRCEIIAKIQLQSQGMNNQQERRLDFRLQRPNQLSLTSEDSAEGVALVSDGTHYFQHLSSLDRYTRKEAPATVSELMQDDFSIIAMMMGPGAGVIPYGGKEFADQLMEGITESEYLGKEAVDGTECHCCRFMQDAIVWKIWIATGPQAVPRKIEFDLSEQFAQAGGAFADAKLTAVTTFDSWDFEPEFSDTDFQFMPPDGAREVADLFESMMESEPESLHPLLGQPAPTVVTDDVEGNPIDLQQFVKKDVVILDFWATWCGPCVRAMPIIAGVADEYADRGVSFFAVNVGEEASDVKEFLKANDLDIQVLMDPDGDISREYQANAIPQTVLIGKSGVVEVVHVGMSGDLRSKLSQELDQLIAGEPLAEMTVASAEKRQQERQQEIEAQSFGVTTAWSAPGAWDAVAVDSDQGAIFAVASTGQMQKLDSEGQGADPIDLAQGGTVRIANLIEGGEPELLTFRPWGETVQAMSADGQPLWDYTLGQGIDDVCAADIDGDGFDEVVVGYNGATGLHLLDHQGEMKWKYTDIGNVWHVTAGNFDGKPGMEVVTTSAQGAVHVFDADGAELKNISVPLYANMVRMIPRQDGAATDALVTGSGDSGEELVTVNYEGEVQVTVALTESADGHVDDTALATTRPWAAVAMRGGLVHVIDLDTSKVIATAAGQGTRPHVAWLPRAEAAPMLLVATGTALNAIEINPPK